MIKTTRIQICSSLCFFKPTLIYVAFLVPSLIFTYFLSSGFSRFLATVPILVLATIFLVTLTKKKKVVLVENPVQDENLTISPKNLFEEKPQPVLETVTQPNTALQSEVCQVHEYQVESPDCPSESESSNDSISSENFDPSWMHSYNMGQNGTMFDDSVSEDDDDDEDSLIEIALPGSESMDIKEEQKEKQHSNLPDILLESIFKQQGLMEVLAETNEVNEEDNLIEIDISMGSIKCSGFEIEA